MKKIIIIMGLFFLLKGQAFALMPPTHYDLNGRIATNNQEMNSYLTDNLKISLKDIVGGQPILEWIKSGGITEDITYIPYARSLNHFHDPLVPNWQDAGFKGNITVSTSYYLDARVINSLGATEKSVFIVWRLLLAGYEGVFLQRVDSYRRGYSEYELRQLLQGLGPIDAPYTRCIRPGAHKKRFSLHIQLRGLGSGHNDQGTRSLCLDCKHARPSFKPVSHEQGRI